MNTVYYVKAVLTVALVTAALRFIPGLLFRHRRIPRSFIQLGKILPEAMMAVLVVYCVKDAQFFYGNFALPEIIGILVCAAVYVWRKNSLLSIGISTLTYMVLVQCVF